MKWTKERYLSLIDDYRKAESLWNVNDTNYNNIKLKRTIISNLASKYEMDRDVFKRKIKNLRSSFHREHHRLAKKGAMARTKWFAYDALKFILDVKDEFWVLDVSDPPAEDTNIDSKLIENKVNSNLKDDIVQNITRKHTKRIKRNTCSKPSFDENSHSEMSLKRDQSSIFGEYVGNEIRNLPPKTQSYVKRIFHNVLFKAALGEYDEKIKQIHAVDKTLYLEISDSDLDNDFISNDVEHDHVIRK